MGARWGATTGGATGFTGANPACALTWQGWRALVSQKITPSPRHGPTEAKARSPGSPRSPCLEQSPEGSRLGARGPGACSLGGGQACVHHTAPSAARKSFGAHQLPGKLGRPRSSLATEAVAHLGVISALPSCPSAGLFLPSGITGQATWAGWLPHLNPFMWLPSSPMGMGPTGVTPDRVGWPLPFLVSEGGSQHGAGKTPFH